MQPLFEYIRQTKKLERPLLFTGFDCQFSSDSSSERIQESLVALLEVDGAMLLQADDEELLDKLLKTIAGSGRYKINEIEHNSYSSMLTRLRAATEHRGTKSKTLPLIRGRWNRHVENLIAMERCIFLRSSAPPFSGNNVDEIINSPKYVLATNSRDAAMADNLEWLANSAHPNQKIVVWGANNHVQYKSSVEANKSMPDGTIPKEKRAGELMHQRFEDQVYTVLAVCYRGSWSAPSIRGAEGYRWQTGKYEPASKGSLAELCHLTCVPEAGSTLSRPEFASVIMVSMTDVTQILNAIQQGDPSASDQLLPLVYEELRVLARQRLANEKPGQTLQATALVHEAYLRLAGKENDQNWDNRGHFFAAAAEAMRRIVVDTARKKKSLKRGVNFDRQELEEIGIEILDNFDEILSVDEALRKLEIENARTAKLVKLRYFAGFTLAEAAKMLGISEPRANQIWAYAKSWLIAELGENFQQS